MGNLKENHTLTHTKIKIKTSEQVFPRTYKKKPLSSKVQAEVKFRLLSNQVLF